MIDQHPSMATSDGSGKQARRSVSLKILKEAGFVLASLICLLLAHYAAVLPHEYAHSFMASALGYKSDPLVIHFGGTSIGNLISLIDINEQVDYATMFARGDGAAAALTGFAGPGLANGAMYLVSLVLLRWPSVQRDLLLFMLVFWFNFMNVANFYDYVPIRTFASHGDIGHITQGLGLSPWTALVVLGIPTAVAMWFLFTRTLPQALGRIAPDSPFRQGFIVNLSVVIMFGYFGLAGFMGYGEPSHTLSALSLGLIPIMLILCWPSRRWMRARVDAFRDPTGLKA
jgi:hypothetical protein